jgi:hypothetical protein
MRTRGPRGYKIETETGFRVSHSKPKGRQSVLRFWFPDVEEPQVLWKRSDLEKLKRFIDKILD